MISKVKCRSADHKIKFSVSIKKCCSSKDTIRIHANRASEKRLKAGKELIQMGAEMLTTA